MAIKWMWHFWLLQRNQFGLAVGATAGVGPHLDVLSEEEAEEVIVAEEDIEVVEVIGVEVVVDDPRQGEDLPSVHADAPDLVLEVHAVVLVSDRNIVLVNDQSLGNGRSPGTNRKARVLRPVNPNPSLNPSPNRSPSLNPSQPLVRDLNLLLRVARNLAVEVERRGD